ncbi:DUF5605 domain-containing protein [Paenibacillus tarimensis]
MIAFLREILQDAPPASRPLPIKDVPVIGVEGEYYLHYYGVHRPAYRDLELPIDSVFMAEWIDIFSTKITRLEGAYSGKCRIELPGKPFFALRLSKQ